MKVECKNRDGYTYLTKGKTYDVISCDDNDYCYAIIADDGNVWRYKKELFEVILEVRNNKKQNKFMCIFNKERIKELESENKILINMLAENNRLLKQSVVNKQDETEYFIFTEDARKLLHDTFTNCPPFTIRKRSGTLVTTCNGDTIHMDWLYCINKDNPTFKPIVNSCKCCDCCCR